MYIIRGDIGPTPANYVSYDFPAEQCFWVTGPSADGGYELTDARLLVRSTSVSINGVTSSQGLIQLNNPVLGYIGKTGRFVAITN